MYKFITAFCLTVITSVCALAQASGEYNRNEFFVGYSNQQVEGGDYQTFHGVEGAYVRNVTRFVGIKAEVSAAYRNEDFQATIANSPFRSEVDNSVYNFLGGVQIKDNASEARLKPFGHALAGVAHSRVKVNSSGGGFANQDFTFRDTGFAAAVGGGLDIRINDRFDFRAIKADYNPIYSEDRFSNNFRFSIGLVIK